MRKIVTIAMVFAIALSTISMPAVQTKAGSLAWSNPTQLTSDAANDGPASIFQDSSGKIWVLFTSDRSGTSQIWYVASTNEGTTWSSPQLFPPTQTPANAASVAQSYLFQDSKGRIWAAWGRWSGSSQEDIYFSTSDDLGNSWSESQLLVGYSDCDGAPSFLEVGNEIWLIFSSWGISYNWDIYYIRTANRGLTWSPPQGIVVDSFRHDWVNAMKDSTGKVWVAYTNLTSPYDPHTSDIWCTTTNDNGSTWTEPKQITSFPSEEMCDTIVDYNGTLYTFYFDRYSPGLHYVTSNNNGATWSTIPEAINDPTIEQHYLHAAVIGDKIWVVWTSKQAGTWDIWLSKTSGTSTLPPSRKLSIKLSGEFDYMPYENIKVRIAALVTYADESALVRGANVTIKIHDPRNNIWVSSNMTEKDQGIYIWESNETVRQIFSHGGMGVYLAHADASKEGCFDASDVVEFHIDPPSASPTENTQLVTILGGTLALIAIIALAIVFIRRKQNH